MGAVTVRPARVCVGLMFVLLIGRSLTSAAATNQTPHGHNYYVFAPYAFQGSRGEGAFITHVGPDGQHYEEGTVLIDSSDDRTNPLCRLDKRVQGGDPQDDFVGVSDALAEKGVDSHRTGGGTMSMPGGSQAGGTGG